MTRLRTVRLPAHVVVSKVSASGDEFRLHPHEDGTTSVEFSGVLTVDGRKTLSPGQLLQFWAASGGIEILNNEQTLRPEDVTSSESRARMGAYLVGLDTVKKVRDSGHTDKEAVEVLQEMRRVAAAQGSTQLTRPDEREALAMADRIMQEMAEDWERAVAFEWTNDDS